MAIVVQFPSIVVAESPLQKETLAPADSLSDVSEKFQWTKQWYPVAVVEFLDPNRPHAIQVLGKDMVLWRDGSGCWQCFEDACPHRLAPLSEGRIEADGTLLCAYHAWRFDGAGNCVRIPQSKTPELEASHCENPKACAISYPSRETQGLLWVWPEAGAAALYESKQRSPRLVPELDDDSERVVKMDWNFRDLPYGWDFFMENVSDPAHVPVSHHGLVGNRYTDAKYYDMIRARNLSTQDGFAFEISPTAPTIERALHDFQPPCLMRIETAFTDGGKLLLILFATPTRPGWCRHIGCQVLIKNNAGKIPKGLAFYALPMPTWLGHVLASLFLHQDLVFLHRQEKIFAKRKGRWLEEVFTPNPQDKMLITFRQWLEQRAGGNIPWPDHSSLLSTEDDRTDLFDVWHTHTKHCSTCQQALQRINRAIWLAWSAATISLLAAVILDTRYVATLAAQEQVTMWHLPPTAVWIVLVVAGVLGVGGYLLKKLSGLFYTYEFSHSDND